jgi:hypothetical protein
VGGQIRGAIIPPVAAKLQFPTVAQGSGRDRGVPARKTLWYRCDAGGTSNERLPSGPISISADALREPVAASGSPSSRRRKPYKLHP